MRHMLPGDRVYRNQQPWIKGTIVDLARDPMAGNVATVDWDDLSYTEEIRTDLRRLRSHHGRPVRSPYYREL